MDYQILAAHFADSGIPTIGFMINWWPTGLFSVSKLLVIERDEEFQLLGRICNFLVVA